jgi:hypothetical protein
VKCDFLQSSSLPIFESSPSGSRQLSIPSEPSPSITGSSHSQQELYSYPHETHAHEHEEWGLLSLKLLQNYSTSTCYTFSAQPTLQNFFRLSIPEIGFNYPFVLHMALATSALHLSRFDKEKELLYKNEADYRYDKALRAATSLMPQVNPENCHALYMFANLCCIFTMARGPLPGDFLLFGEQGVAEWLIFFRSLRPIIEMHMGSLSQGILAPVFQVGMSAANVQHQAIQEIEPLSQLRRFISETVHNQSESEALLKALDGLSPLVSRSHGAESSGKQFNIQELGVWLYCIPDEYVELLQQHQPAALIIMAYVCVLINDLSGNWVLAGWVEHIMRGIYKFLGNGHHLWIRWPMEQIGWIPNL